MSNQRMARWLGPLALGFLVTIVLGLAVVSPQNQPGQNASGADVVAFYRNNGTRTWVAFYLVAAALALLTFYVSGLRHALREANETHSWLSTAAFAGGLIIVAGFAVSGATHIALIEAANNNRPEIASQANFLDQQYPVPVALGVFVLMLATGVAILAGSTLPRWLGVVSVVIAVVSALGGLGFLGLLATPIWLTVLGFVIGRRSMGGQEAEMGEPMRVARSHKLTLRHH
jgi:hypothetical protein